MGNEPEAPRADATIRLGQMALERGWITAEQLREALSEQARDVTAGRKKARQLGNILVSKGWLTPDQLVPLLDEQRARFQAASPPAPPAPSRDLLGKYSILRELGRGGMGVVYEALDTQLNRKVALKMLLTSRNADVQEAKLEEERFLREARLSASLPKHPHIVSVYEAGVLEGKQYLAMEFVDGQSMARWRKAGSVTIRQQVKLLRDVALAVHHAHHHGVIHRDLKPENILIDSRNEPRITDFGLAKTVGQNANLSLTVSGMIMGTPSYMSPEQAQGPKSTDHRTDVYSLGVMLYETLTGRLPFVGETAIEILMKAARSPVPPPSSVVRPGTNPTLDKTVENICLKALAKNPRDRYATADAFAADLTRWLKGDEVHVVPPTARRIYQPTKNLRPWVLAGVGVAGIAAALALVLGPGESAAPAPAEGAVDPAKTAREHLKHGRYEQAVAVADLVKPAARAAALKGEVRLKMLEWADGLYQQKKFQDSFSAYERVLKQFADDPEATSGKRAARRALDEPVAVRPRPDESRPPPRPAPDADDAWLRDVSALSPDEQLRRVLAALRDLNPGLAEKDATATTEEGRVRLLDIKCKELKDIRPLRALSGLEELSVGGAKSLSDLSPIRGLRLKRLTAGETAVTDLAPLRGMPLVALDVTTTRVRDLSPLRGAPIEELYAGMTAITDFSPLAGAPLKILYINSAEAKDLSTLKGLPVEKLGCSWMGIGDLTPLKGMPLRVLDFEHTPVADLSPLRGMPIEELTFTETPVRDLSPLRGMPLRKISFDVRPDRDAAILRSLTTLEQINGVPAAEFWRKNSSAAVVPGEEPFARWVSGQPPDEQARRVAAKLKELNPGFDGKETHKVRDNQVVEFSVSALGITDLSPVKALRKLEVFACQGEWVERTNELKVSELSDLSPLQGLGLTGLCVNRTKVRDLAPLRDMKLVSFSGMTTRVNDLSPLKGMPLTHLECYDTPLADLTPVRGMKLVWLNLEKTAVADLAPLQGMPLVGLLAQKTRVKDWSVLKTLSQLKFLELDLVPERDLPILRSLSALEKVNDQPASEVLKR